MANLAALFPATLSGDSSTRIAAELQLRKLEAQDGMLAATLQLIENSQVDLGARQAASIHLKNRIQNAWNSKELRSNVAPISDADKVFVKQHILGTMTASHHILKIQLKAAVGAIIVEDFPEQWPELLPQIQAVLGTGQEAHTQTALLCLLECFRKYQFRLLSDDRTVPQAMTTQFLPVLLSLATNLLQANPAPASPDNVANILHLILKVYRLSIANELSAHHQDLQGSLIPWGTLFMQIASRELDPAVLPTDEDARERCEWWKAKKWAYFNLVRLFVRYGSPSQLHPNLQAYKPFAENFEAHFAPEIFKCFLKQVELYVQGSPVHWLSQRARKLIVDFIEECVKPKSTWNLLRPHLPLLLQHFFFPMICPSNDELLEFDEDPIEYARSHASEIVTDYFIKPETAVLNLLETLCQCRKKSALVPLVSFAVQIMEEYPAKRTPQEKEGAMKIIGHLADHMVKSKQYKDQMEGLFLRYIFPEFQSPRGFLRARTCLVAETCEKNDMVWSDPNNINLLFDAIMVCLQDNALPVRVQAASAIPELVRYESLRSRVAPNISVIMQDLLRLSNEVDLEVMAETGRKLVEDFSEELIPFAEALTTQLVLSFQRIIQDLLEARETDQDDGSEEKTFSAMSILKTINQLMTTLESSKDILERLELIAAPAIILALQHEFVELYDDVFEIIDALTFHRKAIGAPMWRVFELIHQTFKSDGADYFDSMIASLDNFISFGGEVFTAHPEYLDRLIDIFETAMTSAHLGATDREQACKLAESVMLNLRGQADRIVPLFLSRGLEVITRKNVSEEPIITSSLYLHAIELIVNALFYNPHLTIAFLDSRSATATFFQTWHHKVDRFNRVHDCKLGIMAICAILSELERLPDPVKEAVPSLLYIALRLFSALPKALHNRQKLESEYHDDGDVAADGDDDSTEKALSDDDDEDFQQAEEDFSALMSEKVRAKLKNAAERDGSVSGDSSDEEDADWEEEVLFESPLDKLDAYVEFSRTLQVLQAQQPVFFQLLSQKLPAEQAAVIGQVAHVAAQGGEKIVCKPVAVNGTGN